MNTGKILCIGHLNLEDTYYSDRPPQLKQAGGAALYAAVGARMWHNQVGIVSCRGTNYPETYLKQMLDGGLDVSLCRRIDTDTMAGRTEYASDGSRHYRMYTSREERIRLTPSPEDLPVSELDGVSWIHLGPMKPALQAAWVAHCRSHVETISLDTDVSFVIAETDAIFDLLRDVDIFLPSQIEADACFPSISPELVSETLASFGPKMVIIKRGASGVHVYDRKHKRHLDVPALPTKVVDVTGAGDAFCGGFAATFLQTSDPLQSARCGGVSASLVIQGYGALHALGQRADTIARYLAYYGDQQT